MGDAVAAALERAAREERAIVLASLTRRLGGDLELAEDAVQDAFLDAARDWPRRGIPDRPGAWLTVTARRRAIDRLRRDRARARRQSRQELMERLEHDEPARPSGDAAGAVPDDRLSMIFTCCHPALAPDARQALTLKRLGGLDVPQLARAFLTTEPTMYQRLVRAKRRISRAGIPYRVPDGEQLPERLTGVLGVVYLIFTAGHVATAEDRLRDHELCDEAIRLARLLVALMPDEPETGGLLALLLLTDARRSARTDATGTAVGLDDQDRTLWDRSQIDEGTAILDAALSVGRPGPYQVQAAVAALHAVAPSTDATDWAQIVELYTVLEALDPSPVITLNRAAALARADGPAAALTLLDRIVADGRLDRYQPLHATLAELARSAGDLRRARDEYVLAIALTDNSSERTALERRAATLE
ncbi:MAG: sigma-70 family RNA polymerase sigma factor [Actinomycetota bacterium]|nr:sigma-70 family RNA polymerase sigma factor [Actinomycetota bacterium]